MTDDEEKLLQVKHRVEEAQARDQVRERKIRTRRLIQEGAVVETICPEIKGMTIDSAERYLRGLIGR